MRNVVKIGIVGMVLLLLATVNALAVAVPGQSTTPTQSLPYNLNLTTNITEPDTVVIAVADPDEFSVIAIADIVANHIGAPVLVTPPDELNPFVVETITQMLAYGNLSKAIVIGTDVNTTSIAELIGDIANPITGDNIEVINTIYANTSAVLSGRATVYEWSSASAIIVADGYVQADVSKAILMSAIDDIPVIYEQAGLEAINATAVLLGANTVYATPAVDPDILSGLEDDCGLTVNTMWHNVSSIIDDVEEFIVDAQPTTKNATFVVVKETDLTPYDNFIAAMSIYNLANISVVVANSTNTLGLNQTGFLLMTSPAMTVIVGNTTVASETLATSVAAATNVIPWRLVYDSPIEQYIEIALAGSNYYYPIVVSTYEQVNNTFTYYFKNIGFSNVIKFDDYSLRVTFTKTSGEFTDSTPAPVAQNETLVVYEFSDPIYPHDYLILTFTVAEGTNFSLIPSLEYYAYTAAGTVKPLRSFFDYVVSYFSNAVSWIQDMFNSFVGVLTVYIPLPDYVVMAIAALLTFIILWSLVGLVIYAISLLAGRKVERYEWYGLIVWLIEKVRRRG